jgi:hypothetical protein
VSVRASNNRPKNQQAHALRRNRTNTSAGVANAIAPQSRCRGSRNVPVSVSTLSQCAAHASG